LSNDLDSKLLSDLDGLDEQALRYRVVQLVAEMKDRTKWEVSNAKSYFSFFPKILTHSTK